MNYKLFEARADVINGGLDLNTERGLKWDQISGGSAFRFVRGEGMVTGAGYELKATPVASVGYDGSCWAQIVRDNLLVKLWTKLH